MVHAHTFRANLFLKLGDLEATLHVETILASFQFLMSSEIGAMPQCEQ